MASGQNARQQKTAHSCNSLVCLSGKNLVHDASTFHAGQACIQALILEREPLVIDAQRVQDRGVQIVDVHGILHDVVAMVIGNAEIKAAFESSTGDPGAETTTMMVTAGFRPCPFMAPATS